METIIGKRKNRAFPVYKSNAQEENAVRSQKRKLALSHKILMSVEKPARYIGGEVNAVMKDPDEVEVRFTMCFPDVYEIGRASCRERV